MNYKVNANGKLVNASNVILRDAQKPVIRFNEPLTISFTLPSGTVASGDSFALAIDTDNFLGNQLCAFKASATLDVATQTVTFVDVKTNSEKTLDKTNGKPGLITAQMQVIRYVGGYLNAAQTVVDDCAFLRGIVYVNGATAILLDPNASYTKDELDAMIATAPVFQFSADGTDWHDAQTASDMYVRFKNPAAKNPQWSEKIQFIRVDVSALVARAEAAAEEAEEAKDDAVTAKAQAVQAKEDAVTAKAQAVQAKDDAVTAKGQAVTAKEDAVTAKTQAVQAKDDAVTAKAQAVTAKEDAVIAKGQAVTAKEDAVTAKTQAVNAKITAGQYAEQSENAKNTAQQYKNTVVELAGDVQQQAQAVASAAAEINVAKGQVLTAKAQAVEAKNTAVTAKNDAVQAKNDAVTAKTQAVQAKDDAVTAKAQAVTAKEDAVIAKGQAVTAKEDAVTAKTQAVQAKDDAVTAKGQALTAKTDCQTLKDQSQAIYNSLIAINTFMVGHAYNYGVTVSGTQVSICWTDPSDFVSQEMATISFWQKTRLIYKVGGFPANENDGIVLVDSTVRDQYRESPFTYDMGSTSNYYFALFTCTTGGVWNTTATAPRFTTDALTWATIQMMTRTNTLLQYPGMAIGSVVDIQVNSIYPKLRYKLAHVNYKAHHMQVSDYHYDHTKIYNSIWIPNYLPCIGESNDAHQIQFDAQELSYAQTWDEVFITGKAYYKIVDGSYVQMTAGTDYQNGENIAAWSATEGISAYTKNHSQRVSNGCNSWKDSNLRQWLNATGSGWFSKQNEYDVIGNQGASGWMTGFDQGFLNLIMPVYNKTARNTISAISGGGGGGFDITLDKFWVPSMKEFQNSNTNSIAEGAYWDYFSQVATTAASRIQRDEGGTARNVWLRSPYTGLTYIEYYIYASGSSNYSSASLSYAFLPAMCIA